MGYCFMTVEKVKNAASLTRKYEHNYRTEKVPNADENLKTLNKELVSLNGKTYLDAFHEKINNSDYYNGDKKRKIRKDATIALEVVLTFSREEMEHIDIEKWQKDNVKWLEEQFNRRGDKYGNNVASVVYHADEAGCVHCHALIIPIDEKGALNAKSYLNGRSAMVALQDSYAKAMEPHGLVRGLKGSMATHKDIKKFYTALNQELDISAPTIKKGETLDSYQERVTNALRNERAKSFNKSQKYERKIDEIKTKNKQTLINVKKEKYEVERELHQYQNTFRKLEKEHGDINIMKSKLKTVELLNDGITTFPDTEFEKQTRQNMQKIIDYQKKKEKEKKQQQKQDVK